MSLNLPPKTRTGCDSRAWRARNHVSDELVRSDIDGDTIQHVASPWSQSGPFLEEHPTSRGFIAAGAGKPIFTLPEVSLMSAMEHKASQQGGRWGLSSLRAMQRMLISSSLALLRWCPKA
jgi:hypothetical protein